MVSSHKPVIRYIYFFSTWLVAVVFLTTFAVHVSARDHLAISVDLPGHGILLDEDFSSTFPEKLGDDGRKWVVVTENNDDVQVVEKPEIGMNFAARLLALRGSGHSTVRFPLIRTSYSGRLNLSFNLAYRLPDGAPSVQFSLIDKNGRRGPWLKINTENLSSDHKARFSVSGGGRFLLKRFISNKSAAYPPYLHDVVHTTIRMALDLDEDLFVVEQNFEFSKTRSDFKAVPGYPFENSLEDISALEISVDRGGGGTLFLSALHLEGPVPSSGELDSIIAERRKTLKRAMPQDGTAPYSSMPREEMDLGNALIWQTNPVVHTPDGKLSQYADLVPRLKELGVTVLYFVPLWRSNTSPVGGLLGFPFHDGYSINHAFGSEDDLKNLVELMHRNGIKVMVDFAAHSVAWSSPVAREHPEWLVKLKSEGFYKGYRRILNHSINWIYLYRLDFTYEDVQKRISDILVHWVRTYDIDGIRFDMATAMHDSTTLPVTYRLRWGASYRSKDLIRRWKNEVNKVKPGVLFLMESADERMLLNGGDLDYSGFWRLRKRLKECSTGAMKFSNIVNVVRNDIPLEFKSTRLFMWGLETYDFDPSATYGPTETDGFGENKSKLYMSLISALPGAIIMFGGQEIGDRYYYHQRHDWKAADTELGKFRHGMYDYYRRILGYRNSLRFYEGHPRDIEKVETGSFQVAAFIRKTSAGMFLIIMNHSDSYKDISIRPTGDLMQSRVSERINLMTGEVSKADSRVIDPLNIQPWGAVILRLTA